MADIEFMDPPPSARAGGRTGRVHAGIAARLRAAPGKWARIQTGAAARSLITAIRSGGYTAYQPTGSFEGLSRKSETGGYDIYARYIGENGEHK